MKNWQLQLVGALLLVGAGIAVDHYFIPDTVFSELPQAIDTTQQDSPYKLINPLLFCSDQDISNFTNAISVEMEQKLRNYITTEESQNTLVEASVYYKNLNEGPWVLIHGSMKTVPASLLKVPTAMAVYKHAESDPAFLNKIFTLSATNTTNSTQHFPPDDSIQPGKKYTTEDLVHYMLQDSDNGALFLLGQSLPDQEFKDSFSDLGITIPTEIAPGYIIDAKTYSSFFRVLYNASYLSQSTSEHILDILSKSDFTKGIRAGVPEGTTVADKFGEFTVGPGDLRLNDCGIVYRAHDPYVLCILTRGTDYDTLAKVIANLSSTIWGVLEEQKNQ